MRLTIQGALLGLLFVVLCQLPNCQSAVANQCYKHKFCPSGYARIEVIANSATYGFGDEEHPGQTVHSCAQLCRSKTDYCRGATWNKISKICWIQSGESLVQDMACTFVRVKCCEHKIVYANRYKPDGNGCYKHVSCSNGYARSVAITSAATHGYELEQDHNHKSMKSCEALCNSISNCKAFTFNKDSRVCYPQFSLSLVHDHSCSSMAFQCCKEWTQPNNNFDEDCVPTKGCGSGYARPHRIENVATHGYQQGKYMGHPTAESCADFCRNETGCMGVTFNKDSKQCFTHYQSALTGDNSCTSIRFTCCGGRALYQGPLEYK